MLHKIVFISISLPLLYGNENSRTFAPEEFASKTVREVINYGDTTIEASQIEKQTTTIEEHPPVTEYDHFISSSSRTQMSCATGSSLCMTRLNFPSTLNSQPPGQTITKAEPTNPLLTNFLPWKQIDTKQSGEVVTNLGHSEFGMSLSSLYDGVLHPMTYVETEASQIQKQTTMMEEHQSVTECDHSISPPCPNDDQIPFAIGSSSMTHSDVALTNDSEKSFTFEHEGVPSETKIIDDGTTAQASPIEKKSMIEAETLTMVYDLLAHNAPQIPLESHDQTQQINDDVTQLLSSQRKFTDYTTKPDLIKSESLESLFSIQEEIEKRQTEDRKTIESRPVMEYDPLTLIEHSTHVDQGLRDEDGQYFMDAFETQVPSTTIEEVFHDALIIPECDLVNFTTSGFHLINSMIKRALKFPLTTYVMNQVLQRIHDGGATHFYSHITREYIAGAFPTALKYELVKVTIQGISTMTYTSFDIMSSHRLRAILRGQNLTLTAEMNIYRGAVVPTRDDLSTWWFRLVRCWQWFFGGSYATDPNYTLSSNLQVEIKIDSVDVSADIDVFMVQSPCGVLVTTLGVGRLVHGLWKREMNPKFFERLADIRLPRFELRLSRNFKTTTSALDKGVTEGGLDFIAACMSAMAKQNQGIHTFLETSVSRLVKGIIESIIRKYAVHFDKTCAIPHALLAPVH